MLTLVDDSPGLELSKDDHDAQKRGSAPATDIDLGPRGGAELGTAPNALIFAMESSC